MHVVRRGKRFQLLVVAVVATLGLVAVGCTNPSPPGGQTVTLTATSVHNVSFVGDWPPTFWDPDTAEEPYLVHMGIRITLAPEIKVQTFTTSSYFNGGSFLGKIGSGETLATNDGVSFTGVQLPDLGDLANGAPLELLGSIEFMFDRDQLFPIGVPQLLAGVSDLLNTALPPLLKTGLPTDPGGLVSYIQGLLPAVFTTVIGGAMTVITQFGGGDTFFGFQPAFFLTVGGGLGELMKLALPSAMGLINDAVKTIPDTPFPNGLPLAVGVVGQGLTMKYGTAPATSTYDVGYGWT